MKAFNCYKIDKCCCLSFCPLLHILAKEEYCKKDVWHAITQSTASIMWSRLISYKCLQSKYFFIHFFVFRETVLEGRLMSSRKWVPLRTEWMLWPRDWNKLASSLSAFQQNAQRMGRTGTEYNPVETVYCKQDSWLDIVKAVSFPEKMLVVPFLFTYFSELFAVVDCVSCKFYSFI